MTGLEVLSMTALAILAALGVLASLVGLVSDWWRGRSGRR